MWSENPSQWTILEPLCYSSFVFATLVHGVIGYKFCWLLSEDQNQGTPVGHESNGTTVRDHWEDMNQLRHQLGTNQLLMHPSHIQCKKCMSECLQGIMHGIKINKSELEIY